MRTFPDAASVDLLRADGVRTVVIARPLTAGTAWAAAAQRPVGRLPLSRSEVGDAVVYALAPLPPEAGARPGPPP